MTTNITSVGIVDGWGTEAGGGAIGASYDQESQSMWDRIGSKEKDESESMQRIIAATKPCRGPHCTLTAECSMKPISLPFTLKAERKREGKAIGRSLSTK